MGIIQSGRQREGFRAALFETQARYVCMQLLDLIQWPAMLTTVLGAWWVGSQKKNRRQWGFWLFLSSNLLWVIWGWHDHAYALIALQFALAFINIRGVAKNDQA